jgi:hypothetical protein
MLHGGTKMRRSWLTGLLIFFFLISTFQTLEAQKSSKEVSANVPALTEFHKVVYKIWHTAWPNRDFEMLIALLPEIENGTASLVSTELPGILRHKKTAWEREIEKLQAIVQEYRSAVETKERRSLLDAAEKLHSQFEALVGVIRSPLRQLEDFHVVLYMLYHHYVPTESLDKIKESVEPLREKMTVLSRVALPIRLKEKDAPFEAARKDLEKAVTEFESAVSSSEMGKIKKAVEAMHSRYVTVSAVLE